MSGHLAINIPPILSTVQGRHWKAPWAFLEMQNPNLKHRSCCPTETRQSCCPTKKCKFFFLSPPLFAFAGTWKKCHSQALQTLLLFQSQLDLLHSSQSTGNRLLWTDPTDIETMKTAHTDTIILVGVVVWEEQAKGTMSAIKIDPSAFVHLHSSGHWELHTISTGFLRQ